MSRGRVMSCGWVGAYRFFLYNSYNTHIDFEDKSVKYLNVDSQKLIGILSLLTLEWCHNVSVEVRLVSTEGYCNSFRT